MTRNQRYAEHMARLVAGEFAQDVSLLVAYGSFVSGGQSAVSDVDLYFVPATGRALALSAVFRESLNVLAFLEKNLGEYSGCALRSLSAASVPSYFKCLVHLWFLLA